MLKLINRLRSPPQPRTMRFRAKVYSLMGAMRSGKSLETLKKNERVGESLSSQTRWNCQFRYGYDEFSFV
jgi:hypothetical protein